MPDEPAPSRDPRSFLRDRRKANLPLGAADDVEDLLELQGDWLLRRVRAKANEFRLLHDDLYQEVMLRVLRASIAVDAENRGVRTWLAKCIHSAAVDMVRPTNREALTEPSNLEAAEQANANRCSPRQQEELDLVLDVYHLVERCHLTPPEARAVALRCSGVGMTFKEYAELAGPTHAAVRKQYERGLGKVKSTLGLLDDEHEIMRALYRHGSPRAVASVLGYPEEYVRHVAARAAKKINQFFEGQEGCL